MKQKILITRPLFPDVVDRLREYFDVTINEGAALYLGAAA